MYRYILFDLDGTLSDSKLGIFNCLISAFTQMGVPTPSEDVLRCFIGPPLPDSFREYCGFNEEQIKEGMELFRARYQAVGKFENTPTQGMLALCQELEKQGYIMSLASSKPENMCVEICEKYGFSKYLHQVVGSSLEEDWSKADVIGEAMKRLQLTKADAKEILMVGDRKFDVLGAKEWGIDCVGVEFFGYAPAGELTEAGAVAVVQTVKQLGEFINKTEN